MVSTYGQFSIYFKVITAIKKFKNNMPNLPLFTKKLIIIKSFVLKNKDLYLIDQVWLPTYDHFKDYNYGTKDKS